MSTNDVLGTDDRTPTIPDRFAVPDVAFAVALDAERCCVRLSGELDEDTAAVFSGVIDCQLDHDRLDLTVDLVDLTFFDLRGFAALCAARSRLAERGGRLRVVNGNGLFRTVARWWGADDLLGDAAEQVVPSARRTGPR